MIGDSLVESYWLLCTGIYLLCLYPNQTVIPSCHICPNYETIDTRPMPPPYPRHDCPTSGPRVHEYLCLVPRTCTSVNSCASSWHRGILLSNTYLRQIIPRSNKPKEAHPGLGTPGWILRNKAPWISALDLDQPIIVTTAYADRQSGTAFEKSCRVQAFFLNRHDVPGLNYLQPTLCHQSVFIHREWHMDATSLPELLVTSFAVVAILECLCQGLPFVSALVA